MPKAAKSPASVLQELMSEYQLNPFSLSKAVKLSPSGVRQLVTGKCKVSVPTALRLAKLFGQTPVFWLDLQREADLSEASKDKELQDILKTISKAGKSAAAAAKPKTAKGTRSKSVVKKN
jgi:addiction module HigA family antidote